MTNAYKAGEGNEYKVVVSNRLFSMSFHYISELESEEMQQQQKLTWWMANYYKWVLQYFNKNNMHNERHRDIITSITKRNSSLWLVRSERINHLMIRCLHYSLISNTNWILTKIITTLNEQNRLIALYQYWISGKLS